MARGALKSKPEPTLALDDYLPYLVNRVGVQLVAAFSREAEAFGLSVPMWRVLAVLAQDGELRQIDLAQRTSIDASTLSRLIRTVQGLGYVARARSPASLREVTVKLTARGREVVRALIPRALAYEAQAVDGMSAQEIALLKRLLRRVFGNLDS